MVCASLLDCSAEHTNSFKVPDVFAKAKRAQVMSRIRERGNKDTELELVHVFRAHLSKAGGVINPFAASRISFFPSSDSRGLSMDAFGTRVPFTRRSHGTTLHFGAASLRRTRRTTDRKGVMHGLLSSPGWQLKIRARIALDEFMLADSRT